ncbi:MAG: CDGSH iron-sulfur domain-containing protein [Aestuariivirga sp.]
MAIETVRGRQFIIHFNVSRCIHSRNCVLDRPDVFVPNVKGEWIYPDKASSETMAQLAHNCPSGAIRYERVDGGMGEEPPLVNTMRVRENGPLAINAPLVINGAEAGLRATLCRCGQSKSKPYCDGRHTEAGFLATGEPPKQDSEALAVRNGPVNITPKPNGPLLVSGNLEVVSGTGRTVNRVSKAVLCRCGSSANKPYCDGSHTRVGFKSE